jgi:DNA-binding beta-propeller fold protein YncE
VVTLLFLSGVGLPLALMLGRGDSTPHSVTRPSPLPLRAVLGETIRIPSGAVDVAVGEGAVWVSGFGRMTRLDPDADRVVATVKTPGTEDYSQVAVGLGAVWVTADGGRLYRIDPTTNRVVATILVGGPIQGVETGGGSVWVTRPAEGDGELIRVDPATNRVTGQPIQVGPGPVAVLYAFGALWVTNSAVVRVDPSTSKVSTTGFNGRVAAGFDSLWAAWEDTVVRADPTSGRPTATIRLPRAQAVAVGHGRVWVLASPKSSSPTLFYPVKHTAALWEIDPVTNRIIGTPLRMDALQPIALAVGGRALWVADYNSGTITRLDLVRCARSSCAAASTQWICPAWFAPLPPGFVQGSLGASRTSTTANSWANTSGFTNLNDIPRNGVYVWTLLSPRRRTSPAPSWRRSLRLPLDLQHPDQIASQKGSLLPEYRFAGRYRGIYFVDVRIDFGRQDPTRSMRHRAQTLLGHLRLPPTLVSTPASCH